MISPASKIFSAPPQEVTFSGLLFDMDGTIIDSTDAVVKHWHRFAFPTQRIRDLLQLSLRSASLPFFPHIIDLTSSISLVQFFLLTYLF
jgi:hypothetical protein